MEDLTVPGFYRCVFCKFLKQAKLLFGCCTLAQGFQKWNRPDSMETSGRGVSGSRIIAENNNGTLTLVPDDESEVGALVGLHNNRNL